MDRARRRISSDAAVGASENTPTRNASRSTSHAARATARSAATKNAIHGWSTAAAADDADPSPHHDDQYANAAHAIAAESTAASAARATADASALGPIVGQCVNASVAQRAGNASPGGGPASLFEYYANKAPAGTTAQALALGFFYQMWRGRQLCSVETAWGVLTNMAILSVRPEQPEETRGATNFTVTFKKVRFAGAATVNLGQLSGRNAIQATADAPSPNGNVGQTPVPAAQEQSWLRALVGNVNSPNP